mgnify:CR=1 FL=1
MKKIDTDYQLIPMADITEDAREIAVRWGENMRDGFINQKHKLASDIMNYAKHYAVEVLTEILLLGDNSSRLLQEKIKEIKENKL